MDRLRDLEFNRRKSEFFDENDPAYKRFDYWDTCNAVRLEIQRKATRMCLENRPNWYNRLEQNTGTFNTQTKEYIYDLLNHRISLLWKGRRSTLKNDWKQ